MIHDSIYREAAIKLYEWMDNLKSANGEWAVHPQAFLPADVCCDTAGKYRFQDGMAKIIKDVLEKR